MKERKIEGGTDRKTVELGQSIQPGQRLRAIVPLTISG
jgi:hypothetical protein